MPSRQTHAQTPDTGEFRAGRRGRESGKRYSIFTLFKYHVFVLILTKVWVILPPNSWSLTRSNRRFDVKRLHKTLVLDFSSGELFQTSPSTCGESILIVLASFSHLPLAHDGLSRLRIGRW